jgi:predicted component of type VI protein secretion system
MLDDPRRSTVSAWPRAAALLARQALEAGLAAVWGTRAPGVEHLNMRAQLSCARVYLDADLAGELSYTWHALSRATHHHPYELDPTHDELASLLSAAERVIHCLARQAKKGA